MVAEGAEEQLEALRFDDGRGGRIVDDEMREIGLAGHRAERGELGRGEADEIERARARIGHIIERRFLRGGGQGAGLAEMRVSMARASRRLATHSGNAQSIGLLPVRLEEGIGLGEMAAAEEAAVRRQGRGVGRLQHQVAVWSTKAAFFCA